MLQQEEASREEKIALEKVAAILSTLTARKTDMVNLSFSLFWVNSILAYIDGLAIHKIKVSKATKSFDDSSIQENKKMLLELSNMQQVLALEIEELNEYKEKVKDHYVDQTFSSTECRVAIENSLLEW